MTEVACFCGCAYRFDGHLGVCPRCGEPVDLCPPRQNGQVAALAPAMAARRLTGGAA